MKPFPESIASNLTKVELCVLINIMWGKNQQAIERISGRDFFSSTASLYEKLHCSSIDEVRALVARKTKEEVEEALRRYDAARHTKLGSATGWSPYQTIVARPTRQAVLMQTPAAEPGESLISP